MASTVLEGQLQYFSFVSAAPGYPAPQVILTWTNLFGSVFAYVTNSYIAGASDPSALPGPANTGCQWVGANFSGLGMGPGDPCYSPLLSVYTIGILGQSGFPNFLSQFVVTASLAGDASRLLYGVPTTNIFLPKTANIQFTFELQDLSKDVIIATTPTYGEVALLVAPQDRVNGSIPGCSMACSGCQVICANYTWLLPSFGSSPVLYINASDPCNPPVPSSVGGPSNPIVVSPNCNRFSLRPGRYWATLYGFGTISETSLGVVQSGQPMALADGQPQDMQTGLVALCPGQRSNFTGNCVNSAAVVNTQMSIFTFRIPFSAQNVDGFIMVDRLCNGNTTGLCGQPLHVYVVACAPTGIPTYNRRCDLDSPFPSASNSQLDFVVQGVQGAARINYNLCNNSPMGNNDCLIYVAVYPVCSGPSSPAGVGCAPSLFRATYASDAGVERVSNDCFGLGNTCVLPETVGVLGQTKRYLAYAGDSPTTVTLSAQACSGALQTYYCDAFNGNCQPSSFPGPSNSDLPPATSSPGAGSMDAATFSRVPISGSLFYYGVRPIAMPGTFPSFQVIMQSGSGPLLVPSQSNPAVTATRDATGMTATVTFLPVMLQAPGQLSKPATFATYMVYAFPGTSLPAFNLDTACGNDDAWQSRIAGQVRVFSSSTTALLEGLVPVSPYIVTVVATCGANVCMPGQQMDQRTALMPTVISPVYPSPSPSAAPAPSNAGAAPAGLSAGAAAGISVVALLLVAGGGYFAARRMGWELPSIGGFGGSGGPKYAPVSSSDFFGGSSSSSAYVAPSLNSGGAPATAGETYSAL